MKNKKKKQKNLIYVVAIILIIVMLVVFYIEKNNENYRKIKVDKSKHLVYTKLEKIETNYVKYIPMINIKSGNIDNANTEIDSFVSNYLNNDKTTITYEYNISGIYLSLVVKIEDYSNNYGPDTKFKTYIINLDNKNILTNEEILNNFNLNLQDVFNIIESDFKNYYNEEVEEEYIKSNKCNYKCFLKYRGIDNYLDNVNYYIKDGYLIAYKPFILYSALGDGDYYNPSNYEFLLVEELNE